MKQKLLTFFHDTDLFYMFVYRLSVRRHFIPLLSVFYLSLENTTLNQIGIFSGIWMFMWMLLEIPSGYISDTIGHKKTLYISRFSMIFSLACFILWWSIFVVHSFMFFIFGMIGMKLGFAFNSGTTSAYFYEILESRWEEKNFVKVESKMWGNVSLVAVFFLVLLPFTLQIHYLFPFVMNILFDIVWIFALMKLPDLKDSKKIMKGETQKLSSLLKDSINLWFLPFAFFIGTIWGIMTGLHSFDTLYLEELWLAVVYMWFLMWLSRLLRFIFSRKVHILDEKFSMKQILLWEILLYSLGLALVSYTHNFIIVIVVLAFLKTLMHILWSIHTKYIYKKYLKNPKYKATISSVKWQIVNFIGVWVSFGWWFLMQKSFTFWYGVVSLIMFVWLSTSYYFIFRKK